MFTTATKQPLLTSRSMTPRVRESGIRGSSERSSSQGFSSLLTQANTLAFQLGQGTLAFGALFMTWFLFRTRMVPRTLALWGVVGYAIHLTGAIAEVFGIHIGLVLSLPGGLFEVAFGVWLVAKGFSSVVAVGGADRVQPVPSMAPAR